MNRVTHDALPTMSLSSSMAELLEVVVDDDVEADVGDDDDVSDLSVFR